MNICLKCVLRLMVVFFLFFPSCWGGKPDPLPMVKGPEVTDLVQKINGVILTEAHSKKALTDIEVLSLPTLTKTRLNPITEEATQIINGISGPDEKGRIAYIHGTMNNHYLKIIEIDGKNDQIIFKHSGGFASTGMNSLALAPKGGLVAFIREFEGGVQLNNPSIYLTTGKLEIWDVTKKNQADVATIEAVCGWSSSFLSWFPDGNKLIYVDLVPKQQISDNSSGFEDFKKENPGWNRFPAIYVLDIKTKEKRFLHVGDHPVVSFDGNYILAKVGRQWRLIEMTGCTSKVVKWPGEYGPAIAMPRENLVIYVGLPTEGMQPAFSPYGSFKAGMQMASLKIADFHSGKFQTILYPIDLRHDCAYGGR